MTDIDKVRLITGDRAPAAEVYSDADIEVFLEDEGSVRLAAAALLEAWAALYMLNADAEKIGDYSYSQKIVDRMLNLAKRLRDTEASTPALAWSEMNLSGVEDTTVSEDVE